MFGQNPIRKAEFNNDGQQLWVQECFGTLQGEGPFAGQSAVFVRLAGCNLKCHFCDTDFESSKWNPTLDQLVAKIQAEHDARVPQSKLVVFTGGEPLRQNVVPLFLRLRHGGWSIQVETAGTLCPPELFQRMRYKRGAFTVVCSPKTPGLNAQIVKYVRHYKYIIRAGEIDPDDGLPVMSTQILGMKARLARPPLGSIVYVQPMDEGDAQKNQLNLRAAASSAMRHGYKLSVQMHKLAGLP